ncbi:MAG: phosphoserine phosphatase SerB, partial [Polyangia bacterium]
MPLLITVTGPDHPGIVAALMLVVQQAAGQRGRASVADVEQIVVRGQLTLCLVLHGEDDELVAQLGQAATDHGLRTTSRPVGEEAVSVVRWVITLIGEKLGASHLGDVASVLAVAHANIERILPLSDTALSCVEIVASLPTGVDPDALRRQLLAVSTRHACDIALQREGLYRRAKRLVVLDMDSTLIRIEIIDELARMHGVVGEVSKITEAAMEGRLDFDESLRRRVSMLQGLDERVLAELAANLPLTDGAEVLVRVLKRLGYRVAVISGGFSFAAEALKSRLGLDYAHANTLEIAGGKLTGRVLGTIVNAARKAELLEEIA